MTVRIDKKSLKKDATFDLNKLNLNLMPDSEAAFVAETIVEIERARLGRETQPKAS